MPVDLNTNIVEDWSDTGRDEEVEDEESLALRNQYKHTGCFRQPNQEVELCCDNVSVLSCNPWALVDTLCFTVQLLSEYIDDEVAKGSKEGVREEGDDGEEVEGMVEGEEPDKLDISLRIWELVFLSHALQVDEVLLFVEKGAEWQDNSDTDKDATDEEVDILPLLGSEDPGALTDINISVKDNTNRKQTVKHGDDEGAGYIEATQGRNIEEPKDICCVNDYGDVAEAKEAIHTHQLVDEGGLWLLLDNPQHREVHCTDATGSENAKTWEKVGRQIIKKTCSIRIIVFHSEALVLKSNWTYCDWGLQNQNFWFFS